MKIMERMYSSDKNIEGSLENLKSFMDSKGYSELYSRYINLSKQIPKDTLLNEKEKQFGEFGTESLYLVLDRELRKFEIELEKYNDYKAIYDLINKLNNDTKNVYTKEFDINKYISDCKYLIVLLENVKLDINLQQFTGLLDNAVDTIFNSIKVLSIINNYDLVNYINGLNSELLNEHLASKLRKEIDITSIKGTLEDDHLEANTISECANKDINIHNLINSAKEYERQKIEEEKSLERDKNSLEDIKSKKLKLQLKKALIKFIIVPSLALPLSCPLIGHSIGRKKSNEIELTKTITNYVDIDHNQILKSEEDYKELSLRYVASITICDPWKKSMTGASYIRNCNVYDYELTEEELNDQNFSLNKYNIDVNRLVKKYSYEESASEIDENYLSESQMFMSETYQLQNDRIPSDKYVKEGTLLGLSGMVMLGTGEYFLYQAAGDAVTNQVYGYSNEIDRLSEEEDRITKRLKKANKI